MIAAREGSAPFNENNIMSWLLLIWRLLVSALTGAPGAPVHDARITTAGADTSSATPSVGERATMRAPSDTPSRANVCPAAIQFAPALPATTDDASLLVRIEFWEEVSGFCFSSGGVTATSLGIVAGNADVTGKFTVTHDPNTDRRTAVGTIDSLIAGQSLTIAATTNEYDGSPATVSHTILRTVDSVLVVPTTGPAHLAGGSFGYFGFRIKNVGTGPAVYALHCTASGGLTCNSSHLSKRTTITLAPGDTAKVIATAYATSVEGPSTLSLVASDTMSDASGTGTREVLVTAGAPRLELLTPALRRLRRAECPTFGAVGSAAVQCGDLLYAHALPGYRSRNELRAPTLLYTSASAAPMPVVAMNYARLENETFDRLRAEVRRDGTPLASVVYTAPPAGGGWAEVYRLSIPLDAVALGLGTGAHAIEVRVTQGTGSNWNEASTVTRTGDLLVADRRASALGAGWGLAGVERVHIDARGALIEQGDGTLLFYVRDGSGFRSPADDFSRFERVSGGTFRRIMPGGGMTITYDSARGVATEVQDRNPSPNVARFHWSQGRLDSLVDATGKRIRISYTAAPGASPGTDTVTIEVPGVQPARLVRVNGRLTRIVDPDGRATTFAYDGGGLLQSTNARRVGNVSYHYSQLRRVDSVVASSTPTTMTRRYGSWESSGVPAPGTGTSTSPAAVGNWGATARMTWMDGGKGPFEVRYSIGRGGLPIGVHTLDGSTLLTRDTAGRVIEVVTRRGVRVWQDYDSLGLLRMTRMRVHGGFGQRHLVYIDTTRYEYDPTFRAVTKVVGPSNRSTPGETTAGRDSSRTEYDAHGRVFLAIGPRGDSTQFTWTADGLLERIDPHAPRPGEAASAPTIYAYHPTTRNVTHVERGGMVTTYAYDATVGSDVQAVTDPVTTTTFEYDSLKRTKATVKPGRRIRFGANDRWNGSSFAGGAIDTLVDPLGGVAVRETDALGRVVRDCRADGTCETITYQGSWYPRQVTDRKGTVFALEHAPTGELLSRRALGLGGYQPGSYFAYDRGLVTEADNDSVFIRRWYDELERLVYEEQRIRPLADGQPWTWVSARHRYDRQGRRSRTWLSTAAGGVLQEAYVCVDTILRDIDDTDRDGCDIQRDDFVATDSIVYSYDAAGNLRHLDNTLWRRTAGAGAMRWTFDYDSFDRPIGVTHPTLAGGTVGATREFDALDRTIRYLTQNGGLGSGVDTVDYHSSGLVRRQSSGQREFDYDAIGQLREQRAPGGNEAFVYDSAGNRTQDARWTYEHGAGNRLTAKVGKNTSGCRITYQYDTGGNQQGMTDVYSAGCEPAIMRTYEYDAQGRMQLDRLTTATDTASQRSYWYDVFGRRVLMRSTQLPETGKPIEQGVWRYYWLDDNVAVKTWVPNDAAFLTYGVPSIERDGSGRLVANGQWYIHAPGPDNVLGSINYGMHWLKRQDGPRHLYIRDYRGSVVGAVTDSGTNPGNFLNSGFDAFGKPLGSVSSAAGAQPGYNGQESSGGLVYMRNRWYDPGSGRFTQPDPIGYAGGINLYGYAGNDPVTFSDPYGLCPDSLKQEDGDCKGGLTVSEWQAVESAARKHLKPLARDGVLSLLYAGKIHPMSKADNRYGEEYKGEIWLNRTRTDASTGAVQNIFTLPLFVAKTSAHEYQHTRQSAEFMIKRAYYSAYSNDAYFRSAMEADAESFARINLIP